jgi:hypothetical protein
VESDEVNACIGHDRAYSDFLKWWRYYENPLKNCAAASMVQAGNPDRYRYLALWVDMSYKNDPILPAEKQFVLNAISLVGPHETGPLRDLVFKDSTYDQACHMGKMEMGDDFYAVVRYVLVVKFGDPSTNIRPILKVKFFSVDKPYGEAPLTRDEWWLLLREYVEKGAQMKFCCGKLPGLPNDTCCCGGFTHDGRAQVNISELCCTCGPSFDLICSQDFVAERNALQQNRSCTASDSGVA